MFCHIHYSPCKVSSVNTELQSMQTHGNHTKSWNGKQSKEKGPCFLTLVLKLTFALSFKQLGEKSKRRISFVQGFVLVLGFPGGASSKQRTYQCRRHRRLGFDPWVGKIPWGRKWQLTPVFLPGKSHGQRSLEDCSPQGHKKSRTRFSHLTTISNPNLCLVLNPYFYSNLFNIFLFYNLNRIIFSHLCFIKWGN